MLEIWVIYSGALLGHLVPWTSGCFLSSSMSVCGVIAKHFPTLPLARFPFQHRGKYHVHTFHEYSLNDWMFMLGICGGIGYSVLYFEGLLLVTVFPLWPRFSPCSPILLEIEHVRLYGVHMGCFCFLQIICLYLIKLNALMLGGMLAAILNWHHSSFKLSTYFQRHSRLPTRGLLPAFAFSVAIQ